MPQNFVEKTFTNSRKTTKLVKVFSLKSFLLYGATSSVRDTNYFSECYCEC